MKNNLRNIIVKALKKSLRIEDKEGLVEIQKSGKNIESDYCTNIAMKLAKKLRMNPMDVADKILLQIEKSDMYESSVAKPGYINFIIKNAQKNNIIKEILNSNNLLESFKTDEPKKINIEFISANPTGPLHVGHGRGAVYGNIIAKFLEIQGHNVTKEYYLNDRGNQIETLVSSVFAKIDNRWAANKDDLYQGEYIDTIAKKLKAQLKDILFIYDVLSNKVDESMLNIKDRSLSSKASQKYRKLTELILEMIIDLIRIPLEKLNIKFDNWFSEESDIRTEVISEILEKLKTSGHTIQKDGALMLEADEPRVLIKSDGNFTYFLTDLAYHDLKMNEYDKVINIWGADHHGYVPRMITGLNALGHDTNKLDIHLIQFANLFRGKEKVSMSTRKGEFVELETLRKEIGNDAMNFFYLTKNKDQHLDFDLNLAVTENKNNPVYYIQYAHARIEKILNEAENYQSHKFEPESLDNDLEQNIITTLLDFNEVCEKTIIGLQPHILTHYLQKLAQDFHSYYANVKILTNEINYNRIYLIAAIQKVLKCSLDLFNITAPKEM